MAKKEANPEAAKPSDGAPVEQDNDASQDLPASADASTEPDGSAGEVEKAEDEPVAAAASVAPAVARKVKALVLRSCGFGEPGDVITLDAAEAKTGSDQGALDLADSAVAAAEA